MKRNDRKALEDQIRHMDDAPYNPSPEHIEEIKQRAFQQYMARQSQQTEAPEGQTTKRKGILRRVVIIAAAAVCLMVVSFLYSALAPVTVSSANNVVRRAVIWINDQLHLGITFPEPVDDSSKKEITEYTTFSTLEEAAQRVNLPVIYLTNSNDLKLQKISANVGLYGRITLSIIYSNENDEFSILVYSRKSSNTISFSSANYRTVPSDVGDAFACESEDGAYAFLFYDDYSIRINTSLDLSTFCSLLQNLALFSLN